TRNQIIVYSQSKEKARLPYFGERMVFSSCERSFCRRWSSKKIINSGQQPLTGVEHLGSSWYS
ncbi:MAG: hypothetical protein WAW76_08330, partial [Trichococcus flocculiformis]